jgi:hypothetical protein
MLRHVNGVSTTSIPTTYTITAFGLVQKGPSEKLPMLTGALIPVVLNILYVPHIPQCVRFSTSYKSLTLPRPANAR